MAACAAMTVGGRAGFFGMEGRIAFFDADQSRRLNRRDDGGRSSRLSFVMAAKAAIHVARSYSRSSDGT
jgi:hypothetical protein